jgi:hypothetical protein
MEQIIVDTESSSVREIRSVKQRELDTMIHEGVLREKPFLERLTKCRTKLFDNFENVKGDPPTGYRVQRTEKLVWNLFSTRPIPQKLEFIDPAEIVPNLNRLGYTVDRLYKYIKENVDIRNSNIASERLASIVFSIGTLIHPYIDGNGQTMKSVALSYLEELATEKYRDVSFPKRMSKLDKNSVDIRTSFEFIKHKKISPFDDKSLLSDPDFNILVKVLVSPSPTQPKLKFSKDDLKAYKNRQQEWAKELLKTLKVTPLNNEDPYALITKLNSNAKEATSKKGISQEMIDWSTHTPLSIFVLYLTTTERGEEWLKNFVLDDSRMPLQSVFKTVQWVEPLAQKMFLEVSSNLEKLLIK